ncbi:MAG: 30S ribosomal protein S27e [Candidatus Heimdallarchaeota archaeon]|nr:30S ribosomal protein S27e [Candidatus Heimdallarchaeota archaeon]MCK4954402.1 30S ribosomal protein S27e [Candidatus Heimdallarchaeota archaeon]
MSKVPFPTTKFLRVKCSGCNNEQIVFDSSKIVVKCNVCGSDLAEPKGGKAKILGEILEVLS